MEAPKAGEDCRSLYKYVNQLVNETNALINMSGVFEGRVRGIMGMGFLRLVGNAAELRINTLGGDLQGGDTKRFTDIALVASANPANFGDPVHFTAFIAVDATGLIVFYDNGVAFGVIAVSGGVAVSPTRSNMPSGAHAITAAYGGDFGYFPATVSLIEQINALQPPIVAVVAIPNPARKGIDFVKFIANVTGQNPIPPAPNITGEVAFYIDGSFFTRRTLVFLTGDTWRADTSDDPINYLGFGDHEILARYEGDNHYGAATDTTTLRVKDGANVVLSVEPNPVPLNTTVTLTCVVSHNGPTPTGTVQFADEGGNIGGPVALVNGVASLDVASGNTARTFNIIGHYSGDGNYLPDDSNVVVLNVAVSTLIDMSPSFGAYWWQNIWGAPLGIMCVDNVTTIANHDNVGPPQAVELELVDGYAEARDINGNLIYHGGLSLNVYGNPGFHNTPYEVDWRVQLPIPGAFGVIGWCKIRVRRSDNTILTPDLILGGDPTGHWYEQGGLLFGNLGINPPP